MSEEARGEASSEQSLHLEQGTEEFLTALIKKQCELLKAMAGIILLRPMREQGSASIVKYSTESADDLSPQQYKRLADFATRAAREDRTLVETMSAAQGLLSRAPDYHVLAAPLRLAGRPQGASVCLVPYDETIDRTDGLIRLELSGGMLESYLWKQQAYNEAQSKIQLRETLDLVDKSFRGQTVSEMASIFANEIQRRFGCSRVSIGLVKGHALRVTAMSGVEDLDRRSELLEILEAVMEECADQDTEIRFPQPDELNPSERRVVRAHAVLSEKFGPMALASFPLRVDAGLIGVVIMERDAEDPFTDASLHLLRLIAEYVGPTIWTRRLADRGILAVTRDRTLELAEAAVGPQKTGAKLLALVVLVLLIVSIVVPVSDRVVGQGRIVADVRRQISAPFQGQIEEVKVKPGDQVEAGQILLRLNTTRMELELFEKASELRQLAAQADQARAEGKTHEAMMFESRMQMARAERDVLRYQINQAVVRSPITGTVVFGRLENILNEVVSPEKPLLEIADMTTISAIVLVPESGISRIELGQTGVMVLTAEPSLKLRYKVTRLTPASEVFQQRNVYRVQVEFTDPPSWLRPGMEGQAKTKGRRSNLLMIYTRPLWDAIRLRFWWF